MSTPSSSSALSKRNRSGAPILDSNDAEEASAAGPSKKIRASTSSSSLSPPPPRTKSDRFYYSDGNIILQVQDTDFKVHQSILENQSSVFKDMFEVGREGGEGEGENGSSEAREGERGLPALEQKEGPRTVTLLGDDVGAWNVLLSALYDGVCFTVDHVELDTLYALLLLSDKYEFSSLFDLAERLLIKEADTILTPSFDRTELSGRDLVNPLVVGDILQIIDLGKRFNVGAVLPKAFYVLAKSRVDINAATEESKEIESLTGWELRGLDKDDVVRLFRILQNGLDEQRFFQTTFPLWKQDFHADACVETSACRTSFTDEYTVIWDGKMNRTHLNYRAILLLMIEDTSTWGGSVVCLSIVKKRLKRKLKHYDASL